MVAGCSKMGFFAFRSKASNAQVSQYEAPSEDTISNGNGLHYTTDAGGNTSIPTYQEASGAPVEVISPLGYEVGLVTLVFMNVSKMVGTGIFSTRGCLILRARLDDLHCCFPASIIDL